MRVFVNEWRTPDIAPISCEVCGKRELSSIAARLGWLFRTGGDDKTAFYCPDCRIEDVSLIEIAESAGE